MAFLPVVSLTPLHNRAPWCFSYPIPLMRKLKLREGLGDSHPNPCLRKPGLCPLPREAREVLRDLRESHTEGSGLSAHDDDSSHPPNNTTRMALNCPRCTERLSDLSKVIQLTNCQSSEPFCREPFSLLSCLVAPKSQLPQQQSPGMCNGGGDVGLNSV